MNVTLANNAVSILSLDINAQIKLIQIRPGDGGRFPSPPAGNYYPVTLVDPGRNLEVVHVTARSGDTLTVVRGQENTEARPFAAGAVVELRLTAGIMNTLFSELRSLKERFSALGSAAHGNIGVNPEELPRNEDLPTFGSAAEASVGHDDDDLPTTAMVRQIIGSAIASAKAELLAKDVGLVVYRTGEVPAEDEVVAGGQLLNRADYPELWVYAQASGNVVGSDSQWPTNPGHYSPGDGSTTFRVPDLRGEFLRGWDGGRDIDPDRQFGSHQMDSLQNILGFVDGVRSFFHGDNVQEFGGAFRRITGKPLASSSSSSNGTAANQGFTFDASRVVRTDNETRPRNIAYLACIKTGRLTK